MSFISAVISAYVVDLHQQTLIYEMDVITDVLHNCLPRGRNHGWKEGFKNAERDYASATDEDLGKALLKAFEFSFPSPSTSPVSGTLRDFGYEQLSIVVLLSEYFIFIDVCLLYYCELCVLPFRAESPAFGDRVWRRVPAERENKNFSLVQ